MDTHISPIPAISPGPSVAPAAGIAPPGGHYSHAVCHGDLVFVCRGWRWR